MQQKLQIKVHIVFIAIIFHVAFNFIRNPINPILCNNIIVKIRLNKLSTFKRSSALLCGMHYSMHTAHFVKCSSKICNLRSLYIVHTTFFENSRQHGILELLNKHHVVWSGVSAVSSASAAAASRSSCRIEQLYRNRYWYNSLPHSLSKSNCVSLFFPFFLSLSFFQDMTFSCSISTGAHIQQTQANRCKGREGVRCSLWC